MCASFIRNSPTPLTLPSLAIFASQATKNALAHKLKRGREELCVRLQLKEAEKLAGMLTEAERYTQRRPVKIIVTLCLLSRLSFLRWKSGRSRHRPLGLHCEN